MKKNRLLIIFVILTAATIGGIWQYSNHRAADLAAHRAELARRNAAEMVAFKAKLAAGRAAVPAPLTPAQIGMREGLEKIQAANATLQALRDAPGL